jgi:hypothetical protein
MARQPRSSTAQLSKLLRACLKEGSVVEIDRLGTFRPSRRGGYEFVPCTTPSVFIAYVEEDRNWADAVYDHLASSGFAPWMDRRNLQPGQNWPRAIERSIEISDFFLALLSRRSLAKKGMFQSELRHALDCARKLPLDDVFFIPVRIEDCAVPQSIRQYIQYVDLFPDSQKGLDDVIGMLRRETARRQHS